MPLKRRNVLKPARLRPSITPGTVRIGPFWRGLMQQDGSASHQDAGLAASSQPNLVASMDFCGDWLGIACRSGCGSA